MSNLPNLQSEPRHLSLERAGHREWIGGRIVTLLSHYWRDDDPVELTAAIGADWADVLEGLPQEFIQRACIDYERAEPRRKPTPGEIYQRARAMMPKPKVAASRPETRVEREEREAKQPVVNPDRALEAESILKKVGAKLNQFGGVEKL